MRRDEMCQSQRMLACGLRALDDEVPLSWAADHGSSYLSRCVRRDCCTQATLAGSSGRPGGNLVSASCKSPWSEAFHDMNCELAPQWCRARSMGVRTLVRWKRVYSSQSPVAAG
jgi:hypothetical protein